MLLTNQARRISLLIIVVFAVALTVSAIAWPEHSATAADATPAGTPLTAASATTGFATAYMTIQNHGPSPDRLLAASTDAAQVVTINNLVKVNGIMSAAELPDGVEIPAGASLVFEPGSYQLLLININYDLVLDATFDLTLTFEAAGQVTVPVTILADAPRSAEAVTVGAVSVSAAWVRPTYKVDNCGCAVPRSALDYIPTPTAAATPAS